MVTIRNDYEQAFAGWLYENRVRYVPVDQKKRTILLRNGIKTFDFLVYPKCRSDFDASMLVTEVKGRKFKGKSLTKMSGLQCWVPIEDIQGLLDWQEKFDEPRRKAKAIIVFAYKFELPCVEANGTEVYDYDNNRYVFYAVSVDAYRKNMKPRSPKWRTVTLSAAAFRQLAIPARNLLVNK